MSENTEALKARTMKFALDVCELCKLLPTLEPGPTARRQLVRAATGVAFNHRASGRARSHREFTSRIGVVAEEADESQGWLEFISAANLVPAGVVASLLQESTELCAIFSASYGTARENERRQSRRRP
jgi:four helix bundle protein